MTEENNVFNTFKKSLSANCKVIDRENKKYENTKRVFNGIHNHKRPLFIVQPSTTSDVVKSIKYARENNIEIVARGGGHSFAGYSIVDNGIVVDFSKMRAIVVDTKTKTAIIQPGLLGRDLDNELNHYNLYCVTGTVSNTGVTGLMLHGGFGILTNSTGFALKSVLELEVVTADGEVLICNENENKELFWAMKGSPSNYGMVTRTKIQCHDFKTKNATIYSALRVYPPHEFSNVANNVLKNVPKFSENAFVNFLSTMMKDQRVTVVTCYYNGEQEAAEKELEPVLSFGNPIVSQSGMAPYTFIQQSIDHMFPYYNLYYEKATSGTFKEGTIDYIQKRVLESENDNNFSIMVAPMTHRAYDNTGGCFSLHNYNNGYFVVTDINVAPSEVELYHKATNFLKSFWKDFENYIDSFDTIYLNFLMEDDVNKTKVFGDSTSTLRDLKKKFDPTNFFRKSIKNHDLTN